MLRMLYEIIITIRDTSSRIIEDTGLKNSYFLLAGPFGRYSLFCCLVVIISYLLIPCLYIFFWHVSFLGLFSLLRKLSNPLHLKITISYRERQQSFVWYAHFLSLSLFILGLSLFLYTLGAYSRLNTIGLDFDS